MAFRKPSDQNDGQHVGSQFTARLDIREKQLHRATFTFTVIMASKFRQDMPPPGGYSSIQWARSAPRKGLGGYAIFAIYAGVSAVGLTMHYFSLQKKKREDLEMREGRIAIYPLLLAERHRMFLKQLRKNRDEENELMKNVPGWETGTLWGEPVYHNLVDRFPWVNPEEYYAHVSPKDMYDRMFEKRHH